MLTSSGISPQLCLMSMPQIQCNISNASSPGWPIFTSECCWGVSLSDIYMFNTNPYLDMDEQQQSLHNHLLQANHRRALTQNPKPWSPNLCWIWCAANWGLCCIHLHLVKSYFGVLHLEKGTCWVLKCRIFYQMYILVRYLYTKAYKKHFKVILCFGCSLEMTRSFTFLPLHVRYHLYNPTVPECGIKICTCLLLRSLSLQARREPLPWIFN